MDWIVYCTKFSNCNDPKNKLLESVRKSIIKYGKIDSEVDKTNPRKRKMELELSDEDLVILNELVPADGSIKVIKLLKVYEYENEFGEDVKLTSDAYVRIIDSNEVCKITKMFIYREKIIVIGEKNVGYTSNSEGNMLSLYLNLGNLW